MALRRRLLGGCEVAAEDGLAACDRLADRADGRESGGRPRSSGRPSTARQTSSSPPGDEGPAVGGVRVHERADLLDEPLDHGVEAGARSSVPRPPSAAHAAPQRDGRSRGADGPCRSAIAASRATASASEISAGRPRRRFVAVQAEHADQAVERRRWAWRATRARRDRRARAGRPAPDRRARTLRARRRSRPCGARARPGCSRAAGSRPRAAAPPRRSHSATTGIGPPGSPRRMKQRTTPSAFASLGRRRRGGARRGRAGSGARARSARPAARARAPPRARGRPDPLERETRLGREGLHQRQLAPRRRRAAPGRPRPRRRSRAPPRSPGRTRSSSRRAIAFSRWFTIGDASAS